MRLISVRANKEAFHPVIFKETGLNFIVAQQKEPGSSEDGKTYNGVGKSLLIRIINFCLGAKPENYKEFCMKLPGWEFQLEFKINVQKFISTRKTDDAGKIYLNNEELSIKKFNDLMEEYCFTKLNDIGFLSFRSLIPFFLRPLKESYVDCMKPVKVGKEYQSLLNNSFLMGLDITLVEKKYNLRKTQEEIKRMEQLFKDNSFLHDFRMGNRDVGLELENINDQIKKIEDDLSNFKLAEDYHAIQLKADAIEQELYTINNKIILIQNNIDNIEKSLVIIPSSNITNSELERIYNEAKIVFPESVKKTLSEVEQFYKDLVTNRNRRLSEQKNQLAINLLEKKRKKDILQPEFDKLISYLGNHQALDVFVALNKQAGDLKNKRNTLLQFRTMQNEYHMKDLQTKSELIELEKITAGYLNHIEEETKGIRNFFRDLAQKFYTQSASGITINANTGENQLLFTIDAKIPSDASDGINNVKLFCYDLTILLKGKNHFINFIFHDSRLFDGIDERQLAVMFQVLQLYFTSTGKQYIATINQNQLNNLNNMYRNIIEENIVLTLTDDFDSEKLLGIKVDIGNK